MAGEDAFWNFIDSVFEYQTNLTDAGFKGTAVQAGVNGDNFSTCYTAKKLDNEITADLTSGEKAGVTGTPGNFIMNKKGEVWVIPGAVPFETLKATIDEALK